VHVDIDGKWTYGFQRTNLVVIQFQSTKININIINTMIEEKLGEREGEESRGILKTKN
jgi:Glu-tRNA(Gln) amidotransferase subunit E-like FAD-binding protein